MISVCIITYNHENYIFQALESVLAQKGVEIEVIIGDDCSKDNTYRIIKNFVGQNNLDWKILPNKKNIGMSNNWQRCINAASGDFIALLEGDDYWIDRYKLSKQLDILNANPSAVACFSNANIVNEVNDRVYHAYVTDSLSILSFSDLLNGNLIPTCTTLFRNRTLNFHKAFHASPYVDWILHLMNTEHGHYEYLNEKTATYRMHGNGAYGGISELERDVKCLKTMCCISEIYKSSKYIDEIKKKIKLQHDKIAYKKLALGDRFGFFSHKLKSKFA